MKEFAIKTAAWCWKQPLAMLAIGACLGGWWMSWCLTHGYEKDIKQTNERLVIEGVKGFSKVSKSYYWTADPQWYGDGRELTYTEKVKGALEDGGDPSYRR